MIRHRRKIGDWEMLHFFSFLGLGRRHKGEAEEAGVH